MPKTKITIKKSNLTSKTLINMAEALNEIKIDFEVLDELIERADKIKVLKQIRDDLTDIFWNYKLVKKNKYDTSNR